jgi:hypothetical protein
METIDENKAIKKGFPSLIDAKITGTRNRTMIEHLQRDSGKSLCCSE